MVNGKATRSNSLTDSPTPATLNDVLRITKDLKTEILVPLKEEFVALGDHLQKLEYRIGNLESSIESFRRIQNRQQTEINEIKLSLSKIQLSKSEILDEMEDRERRRNNVILFGLPEHDEGTVAERKQHDESLVQEVFEAIDCDDVETDAILRLGRNVSGRLRPVKVTLSDRSSKAEIMRKSRDLRKSDNFKRVFISNDKTKLQQTEWSDLRKELLRRKELGEDVVIYNGKVALLSSLKNFRM